MNKYSRYKKEKKNETISNGQLKNIYRNLFRK